MWYFVLRMLLVAFIAAVGLNCISVNAFGPMYTGYILLLVAGFWLVLEFIAAVEQIVNAKKFQDQPTVPIQDPLYMDMPDFRSKLLYVIDHPERFREDQVQRAHTELDKLDGQR